MERRREPRFPVSSAIRVIVPGHPPRMVDARLIDISATGIRFLSDENIKAEGIAGIEVDSRLVLAELRYSEKRGDKFVFGARRLHEVSKDAQLGDVTGAVLEMLGAFHYHITDGKKRDSEAMALAVMEEIVERRESGEAATATHPEPAPAPAAEPAAKVVESAPAKGEPVIEAHKVRPAEVKPTAPAHRAPDPIEAPIEAKAANPAQPLHVEPVQPPPAPGAPQVRRAAEVKPAASRAPHPIKAPIEAKAANPAQPLRAEPVQPPPAPGAPQVRPAVEVRVPRTAPSATPVNRALDPVVVHPVSPQRVDPLEAARVSAAAAIAEMQNGPPRGKSADGRISLAIAAALVLAVALTAVFLVHRTQAKAPTSEPPPAPVAAQAPGAPVILPSTPPDNPPATPPDNPSTTPAAVQHALIRAIRPTWISIRADGREVFKGSLHSVQEVRFTEECTIGVANGANVRLTLNGSPVPVDAGEQRIELTAGRRP